MTDSTAAQNAGTSAVSTPVAQMPVTSPPGASTPAAAETAAAPPAKTHSKLKMVVYGLVAAVMALIAVARLMTANDLPGCSATATQDVIRSIFKSKDLVPSAFADTTTVSTSDTLITCTMAATLPEGVLLLDYKISPSETAGNFKVEITQARPK